MSYDSFHNNNDQVYRFVGGHLNEENDDVGALVQIPGALAQLLEDEIPGIEHAARVFGGMFGLENLLMSSDQDNFIETKFFFADDDIFKILTIPLIQGDPQNALTGPNKIVISKSTALKYFGDKNPIGKNLYFDGVEPMAVTGVFEDCPENTHIHFNMLGSFDTAPTIFGQEFYDDIFGINAFNYFNCNTYVKMSEGIDPADLRGQLDAFLDTYLTDTDEETGEVYPGSESFRLIPQKISDIHLKSHERNEIEQNSDPRYLTILILVAVFILVVAIFNYINMSTARSIRRSREVGLRKAIGAGRSSLIYQFLGESIITTFVSLVLALIMVELALPVLNSLIGKSLGSTIIANPETIGIILALFVFTSVTAGIYPAFYLSGFSPVSVLKGTFSGGLRISNFRRVLVVFQFTISIALISVVSVMFLQMKHMTNVELGYDRENILVTVPGMKIKEKYPLFKEKLLADSHVASVTHSKNTPTMEINDGQTGVGEINGEMKPLKHWMAMVSIGDDFFETFGMEFVAGRAYDPQIDPEDEPSYVLSEKAVRLCGWDSPEAAVNSRLQIDGQEGTIVGVSKDIYYETLYDGHFPLLFIQDPWSAYYVSIRLNPGDVASSLKAVEKIWYDIDPNYPFEYSFLDDRIDKQYNRESVMMQLFIVASILAVIIASMGLYGLTTTTVEKRTKEIGIRKVLGASVFSVVSLLSRQFLLLVTIASGLAWVISYFILRYWLQEFADRIILSPAIFILAAFAAILIALTTTGLQAIRAARMNPVDSLRNE